MIDSLSGAVKHKKRGPCERASFLYDSPSRGIFQRVKEIYRKFRRGIFLFLGQIKPFVQGLDSIFRIFIPDYTGDSNF